MTTLSAGASQLRKRPSMALAKLGLAATTLIGGAALLSGGSAQAFNCTFGIPGGSCQTGVWIDSDPVATDKQIMLKVLPTTGSGNVEYKWVDVNGNGTWNQAADWRVDQWHVDVDFNPNDLLYTDGLSQFEYIMKITDPGATFYDVSLSSIIAPPNRGTVSKQLFSVGPGNTKGSPITALLTDNGMAGLAGFTEVYVVDTALALDAGNPGTVDSYQNAYRQQPVPGPLPILGAGAAFGYTRRLRRRMKFTRLA